MSVVKNAIVGFVGERIGSVARVAAVTSISPSFRFIDLESEVFRKAVWKPGYVLNRRLERAKSLLQKTLMPLVSIAAACGFSSQTHMTDLFRFHLGKTPLHYRRNS